MVVTPFGPVMLELCRTLTFQYLVLGKSVRTEEIIQLLCHLRVSGHLLLGQRF